MSTITLQSILRAAASDDIVRDRLIHYIAESEDPVGEAKQILAAAQARSEAEEAAGIQQAREAEERRKPRSVADIVRAIPMDSGTADELLKAIAAQGAAPAT